MINFLTTPVPHEEARRMIAGKPAVARDIYDALPEEMKARAFTITGIEDMDVLQAVRDEIAKLPAGADWNKAKKEIMARISPWFTKEAAEARAHLLMSHHAFAAYSSTQARIMDAMIDVFPYRQYLSTKDGKVRASHAALHEIILPANHPFWQYHTPPWEWNCRCQVVELTAEDRDEEHARDQKRAPENRRVLEGPHLAQLDTGSLNRGLSTQIDIRTPKERGGSYQWSARDTTLPYEEIRKRWTPEVALAFEEWAGEQAIGGGGSLMNWLRGLEEGMPKNLGEFVAAAPAASVPAQALARLLQAEPAHPVAQAVKLWGDDEKLFTEMMMEDTPAAVEWRQTMEATLRKLKPMPGEPTLYRGWKFETAEEMEDFMVKHRAGFIQERVGMSASLDLAVAARDKFSGGEHSMIWEIQGTRRAVDARPLFEAVGAVAHTEREQEVIFPAGGIYRWVDKDGREIEEKDSAGNARKIRLYTLQEEAP